MSFAMSYPLLYLAFGMLAERLRLDWRGAGAALLLRVVIPVVVAFNIATGPADVFVLIVGMMLLMLLGLVLAHCVSKDGVVGLCFFYLNIGWLGLPIASSAFGPEAARFFIALYVGSSIFGNSVAPGAFGEQGGLPARVRRVLLSPTSFGLCAGLACAPWADTITAHLSGLYVVFRWAMGFLGMAILGMWLASRPLKRADAWRAARLYLAKTGYWLAAGLACVQIARMTGFAFVAGNAPAVGLLALLPPAANIIVLETHYRRTGESAPLIAWGTAFSIVAVILYVGAIKAWG